MSELCAHNHAVQFYENDDYLCDVVASFVAEGLAEVQPIIIIATAEHRAGISTRLRAYGYDFERVLTSGQLMYLDAHTALSVFMRDGMPDANLFENTIGRVVGERLHAHRSRTMRAYGEMVDVLWRDGNAAGAVKLEELWNQLGERHSFSLLCAYSIANFYKISDAEYFDRICAAHSRVIPTESIATLPDTDSQARQVTMLQQRTVALKAELEKAHRAKADFLAVMSHELRTPLNAILGYDDLLQQEVAGPTTDEQKMYIGRIRSGAEQLMTMIDQVLALSRLQSGEDSLTLSEFDIGAVIDEVVQRVRPAVEARGLLIETELLTGHFSCYSDELKVRQILLNLLSNATKFTEQGTIRITLSMVSGSLSIDVADTGVGMGSNELARVFEPFEQGDASTTRRFGGIGAGLAISRDFACLLGGSLSVKSQPGRGSVFTLRLPQRAFPYLRASASTPQPTGALQSSTQPPSGPAQLPAHSPVV
jgi:signal transduction histidine kinase